MQIDYTVSKNGLRIDTFPRGVLDIQGTIDYFSRLKHDRTIRQGAVEIVYFKHVSDFKISFLESEKITARYHEPGKHRNITATIFVCESDIAFGIGRMLQTYHELSNPDHNVIVVRSESELKDAASDIEAYGCDDSENHEG